MDRVIIDVREPEEYATDHVEGAINIPPSEIMTGSHKLDDIPRIPNSFYTVFLVVGLTFRLIYYDHKALQT